MAIPVGRTLFKKKDGILTLTRDHQTVTWTPNTGGPPTISLPVASITNLQQTPDSSPKVMLKIFEKAENGADPVAYLFHFNTSEAKVEAKVVKDVLSRLLADLRANDAGIPRPTAGTLSAAGSSTPVGNGGGGGSVSASMAFASAVNSQPSSTRWFDDGQLKADIELQQSLMKKDKNLHQTYVEAISTKPESISGAAFNSQFWSTRTNLLRSHAIEINQKRGAYNVLSTVKPRTVDGELKLNISVEQVQMIFAQHPLVKRIYNENVPKLSEAEFWSRFFLSRLSKKLRGERVTDNDRPDPLFDKYDVGENTQGFQSKIMAQTVPHIIDLEANEENQGGVRSGNAKDVEMRPRANITIVKTLNSLSEKIMANVAPSDANIDDGQGPYDTYNELALRDLMGDAKEHRIMLNVKEQNKFFSKRESAPSANARIFAKQNTAEVLSKLRRALQSFEAAGADRTGLQAAIDFDDESDSDDEQKRSHVGSRAAIKAAEKEVMDGVLQQRSQKYCHASDATSPMGIPPHIAAKCALTHATTIEFLHQFWNAFLSGEPDRAAELQYLSESLGRSAARVAAVADEAEVEREAIIRRRKQEIRDHFDRTGKRIRWKADMVCGGRDAVVKLMQPVLDALDKAQGNYSRALAAEGIQISTER
ncbi:putative RNA polymerase II transcription factor B subunit 1 [Tolypocladium ophioglossoides CBS 100239]|uniref:Putative RNA polymerase II transcription factor B subunit 1 n=1 Tax=Tolypocladium ophioglossoides (strain CBS 100239) TaxID=1163406 RepID=A0A0L0NF61_TOLOC|nr:putative RNA polymerase II transcription factor B subunit 1 [Tolypocladium ophioglossoides CBS 100239]